MKTIHTKAGMAQGARIQYRNYFRTMALGGTWNLYRAPEGETLSGVILAPTGDMNHIGAHGGILVSNVQAMTEETMCVRLADALTRAAA